MEKYKQLLQVISSLEKDFSKFYNDSNKAAGTRIRVGMQELKAIAQEVRTEVSSKKNKEAAPATKKPAKKK